MSKIKQSIIAQRQLPEHIRENYPVFVEFIKAYYDFLQESQGQQLEKIRDVDTTLEEFIDRFKSELAKNFPIHLASDKAMVLKHLREFYLSRGSEDSFKFLFNVLFSKNAEVFYPSAQMLRVSDGKWHQDVSIFIQPLNEIPDITQLNGKFINITNHHGKPINTYIENVVKYSDYIYEFFIQRDYMNEIDIGSIVETIDGTHKGTVLQCPTSLKVFKGGKGFKVGDIYALKTQLGRGCVIKITKVGSLGEIKNIKVIRFGLDYKVKFYSYLSSKELAAWEYIHPLALNHPYNAAEPHYNEKSGGFVDSGWAAKQTYMYYDPAIDVKASMDPSRASDRFFADPSYVGEVVEQFYADDSKKPIDEDLAIIEIDLGAVAKYPGYYLKADGFISDEMYIQDGQYYQAFSYVVRVEEELRKYADIVRALVHPSGMKLYSEYRIFNVLNVAAISRKITRLLQLPVKGRAPSVVTVTNRGISYNNYITIPIPDGGFTVDMPSTLINAGYVTYPDPILNLEYEGSNGEIQSRQGKAAKHSGKSISDLVSQTEFRAMLLSKDVRDTFGMLDAQVKGVTKNVADIISEYIETRAFSATKNLNDNVTQPETLSKAFDTLKTDVQLILDSYDNFVSKPVVDVITAITDENVKELTKNLADAIIPADVRAPEYIKNLIDGITQLDTQVKDYSKDLLEDIYNSDVYETVYGKNLVEIVNILDDLQNSTEKLVQDAVPVLDDVTKIYTDKPHDDEFSVLDADTLETIKNFSDALDQLDEYVLSTTKLITDAIDALDNTSKGLVKAPFEDAFSMSDVYINRLNKIFDDTISFAEDVLLARGILLDDPVVIDDTLANSFTRPLADSQAILDEGILRVLENRKSDLINTITTGRLRLSPYDQEAYFAVFEDYQPAITIT